MSEPLRVEVVRSGFVESVHLVDVAVVDATGAVVAHAGDPDTPAAFRSSSKPIQARASREAGWAPADARALAIACASHNGEAAHVEAARAVLARAGVDESALACPADVPASIDAALGVTERRAIYHNCSGKHSAMLAACAAADFPLAGYREAGHRLQQRMLSTIEQFCGAKAAAVLVDGCGVPTPVMTLRAFARGFLAIDGGPEAAAMRAHPFLVGGTARFDTDLMIAAPHVLTKAGAEGLACASAGGFGIALKSRDGFAGRFRGPAMLHVLVALGLVDGETLDALAAHRRVPVLGGGAPVGEARAVGSLQRRTGC